LRFRNYAFSGLRKISFVLRNDSAMSERVYRLTKAGRAAWESEDLAVPADYRRLLWLMDFHGHPGLIRQLMTSYPRAALDEWLAEMEQIGLVEQVPAGQELEQDFTAPSADRTQALDEARVGEESQAARALLDIALPDGDGFDILSRMRRHKVLASLPIILLTAKKDAADIGRGLALGADGYITKPYTKSILVDVVRAVLKQAGNEEAAQ
jgi:CheY-like chemotaxis protein